MLTSTLSGFSVPRLVALNLYTFPVMVIVGRIFILKSKSNGKPGYRDSGSSIDGAAASGAPMRGLRSVLSGFAPLIFILGTYVVLAVVWQAFGLGAGFEPSKAVLIGKYAPILLGIAAGALYVGRRGRGRGVFRGSLDAGTLKLIGVVAGVRVFSALLQAGGATSPHPRNSPRRGFRPWWWPLPSPRLRSRHGRRIWIRGAFLSYRAGPL